MNDMPDTPPIFHGQHPLRSVRRREIAVWCVAAPLVAGAAWWAFGPHGRVSDIAASDPSAAPPPEKSHAPLSDPHAEQEIDPHVFAINLWHLPAAPVDVAAVAQAEAATSKPLNLQLIGIISDGTGATSTLRAALYDVDEDRLLIVADGERVHDRTLRILPGGLVELGEGQSKQRLLLRPDKEVSS